MMPGRNSSLKPGESNASTVRAAVTACGLELQFAAPKLKSDRDTVLVAVAQDGTALQFAADELKLAV